MTSKERDQLRKLQNKLLATTVAKKWAADHGENKPLWRGGPATFQLKAMLYPQWKDRIEQLLDEFSK